MISITYEWKGGVDESPLSMDAETRKVRTRYDRIARLYDVEEYFIERLVFRRWRARLWSLVPAGVGLEVGMGTGKNIPYYPPGSSVVAVDISPRMLARASRLSARLRSDVRLIEMDAGHLDFSDHAFDWVVATFVFCSIPDPVKGLREIAQVLKPGRRLYLLEHLRINRPILGRAMDLLNPLVVRLIGANINHRTVENVLAAGLRFERSDDLAPLGLVKLLVVHP